MRKRYTLSAILAIHSKTCKQFIFLIALAGIAQLACAQSWSLTGNTGTTPPTNFIGTADSAAFMIKVFNKKSGYIDGSSTLANTSFGFQALLNNTGKNNSAFGYISLNKNTTGGYNTANGIYTLYSNTKGDCNVAVGASALYKNTTKSNLVAIGDSALFNNGVGAVTPHEASGNTAVGSKALYSNTTGFYNTANGSNALYSNTTGFNNTANGYFALSFNKGGSDNTANGSHALHYNKGSDNTANGSAALSLNTSGSGNTANGTAALISNTTGAGNTANGSRALFFNTTGSYNTANGAYALFYNTAGTNNTALGSYADELTVALTNATAIGYSATVDASNKVRVGNTNVTSIGGQVSWSAFSDGRYKKNIKEDVQGLVFINSLRPITYTVDIGSLDEYYDKGRKHDSAYEKMKADMQPSADAAAKIVYNGFIAQEVEAAAKKLNYEFSGVDKPKTKDGLYGLRYAEFVVPLVKAVQELSSKNDAKDAEINDLKTRLSKLEAMMNVQQSAVTKN